MRNLMLKPLQKFLYSVMHESKCTDKKVAALICSKDLHQVLSIGINGGAKGGIHECLCLTDSKYSCVHAEINALIKLHTFAADKIMLTTLSPCMQCAAAIINEPGGFYAVCFKTWYKDSEAIEMLLDAGIKVGHIVDDCSVKWLNKKDVLTAHCIV